MTENRFFPYGKQSINQSDIQAVQESLTQDFITRGPKTESFEKAFAEYVGAKYAVSFNSGSSALFASFFAANVTASDRFITTPNSFVASSGCGMRLKLKPQFVDIDLSSGNLSIPELQKVLEEPSPTRGKYVILPVHFSGIAVDVQKIDKLLKTPDVVVIEDAAHAIGSSYPQTEEKVGSCTYSHMAVFSFHPVKTITSGEGGMVTTNDDALNHRLRIFRNNGIESKKPYLMKEEAPWYYEVHDITGNFHLTEMQAALGLSQLARVDSFIEKRRALVKRYRQHLENVSHLKLFDKSHDEKTAYHLMVVQFDFKALNTTKSELMEKLKSFGIGSQFHYIPIYRHPAYEKLYGKEPGLFPNMETYFEQALSLPLYYDLTEENVDFICDTLKNILAIR